MKKLECSSETERDGGESDGVESSIWAQNAGGGGGCEGSTRRPA
eukprot:CAMPEP_0195619492 /NCGR_PEP_ID=MMETSP0815-20121206/14644_1 /TAXON_ID=97485 /ORGANISM="Prymnesium parvum, Strain Texoma1" /LENGTH=43 /DNA_ID= /DNA_START= /DNA_END= /DNA_ORIENTATION=